MRGSGLMRRGGTWLAAALMGLALAGQTRAEAAFPPGANGLITFRTGGDIWLMNPDGSNPRLFITGGAPTFSPDGSRMAFYAFDEGDADIFTIGLDGSDRRNLTAPGNEVQVEPQYAPDGDLVFQQGELHVDVFSMGFDGSNPTNLMLGPLQGQAPTVSPDGTQIAFNTNDGGDSDVFVMGRDGSSPTNLTSSNPGFDNFPAFSPDGTRILFLSDRGGSIDLYTMARDGSDPRPVAFGSPLTEQNAVFSPDGTQIVFDATPLGPRAGGPARGGTANNDIFVMGADGSNPTNLTSTPMRDENLPDWQRLEPPHLDTDPPETLIDNGPKRKTEKRKAKFAFSADEPASFLCKLDKKSFEPCEASEKFKVKPDKHKLKVQAVDLAGNVDPTPAKRKWKVLEG